MRWEDERYVRVYTRDTPEWSALSWEARSVFWGLLRRCDRAGILQVGKAGLRALAGVIPSPLEVVERAVPELLADGCLQAKDGAYFVPNFMTAQEAHTSDAQRKRDQRERDRARLAAQGVVASPAAADKAAALERSGVTGRDCASPAGVTCGHAASAAVTQEVTPSHSVPSRAVPDQEATLSAGADLFPSAPLAPTFSERDLQALWNLHAARAGWARWDAMPETRRRPALARLREHPERGWWETVLLRAEKSAFLRGENDRGFRFNPDTLLRAGRAESVLEGKYDGGGHGGKVVTTIPERKVQVL